MSTHRRVTGRTWRRTMGSFAAAGAVVAGAGFAAAPAFADNTSVEYFDCGGTPTAIQVHETHSETTWGAGKVVEGGSGTLIPTSFGQSAFDDTKEHSLFQQMAIGKGGGHANQQQDQITCTQSFQATLGDLLADGPPPVELPTWAEDSDLVTVTFSVTAVRVP